jgi:hypothetical protein
MLTPAVAGYSLLWLSTTLCSSHTSSYMCRTSNLVIILISYTNSWCLCNMIIIVLSTEKTNTQTAVTNYNNSLIPSTLKLRDAEDGQSNTKLGWTAGRLDTDGWTSVRARWWDEDSVVLGHSNEYGAEQRHVHAKMSPHTPCTRTQLQKSPQ